MPPHVRILVPSPGTSGAFSELCGLPCSSSVKISHWPLVGNFRKCADHEFCNVVSAFYEREKKNFCCFPLYSINLEITLQMRFCGHWGDWPDKRTYCKNPHWTSGIHMVKGRLTSTCVWARTHKIQFNCSNSVHKVSLLFNKTLFKKRYLLLYCNNIPMC